MVKIISGKDVAEKILTTNIKTKVDDLKLKGVIPTLVVILVGDAQASASYVRQK